MLDIIQNWSIIKTLIILKRGVSKKLKEDLKMNSKKIVCLLLAVVMVFGLAACNKAPAEKPSGTSGNGTNESKPESTGDPYAELADDYDALSDAIYNDVLGDFLTAYQAAKEAESLSERYALMAVAEAKLLESSVMLPLSSRGGNYAISRLVPNTVTSVLWGNDNDRFHNALVATEPLTKEHRDELKTMWAELKGTGTWEAEAKKYMADHGYTLKDTYNMGYIGDPNTWDTLATSLAADTQAIVNTYDGLVEYDSENEMKPALAEKWEVSEDGLTYTFTIRQGAKWVDSQGRELAEVTADDFVAGMQHMMDAQAGLEYLVQGIIKNASEYITGDITDFAQVGVKAVDKYTLQYTLEQPTSFFETMLSYGIFAPMNREFYVSKGGKFGAEFDNTASSYTYGKTHNDIAYCGPYLVSNATPENTIVFKANPSYWNAENITIKTLTWLFNDGKDATKPYKDTMSGTLDGAGLTAPAVEAAKADGVFDKLAYVTTTDATTFSAFYNVNRLAFANANDGGAATNKSEEECKRATDAMRNQHFRLAVSMATDRANYSAQVVGEELKLTSIRNSYTPGTFLTLPEDTTIKIDGTDTTFKAGTYYGEIMQAQIDADKLPIKVWDPAADDGLGSSDGFDGWYNPEAAVKELEIAIEELAAQGVEVSAEKPILIDLPYFSGAPAYNNRSNAYKQSIETVLGGKVILNLIECTSSDIWQNAGYFPRVGSDMNYDIYDLSGWGPDYGDPQTYLDTFLPDYAGTVTKCIGLF